MIPNPTDPTAVSPVSAALSTSSIMNGTTPLVPKFASVNVAASVTDGILITAVSGKQLRVLSASIQGLVASLASDIRTKPSGAGTTIFANVTPVVTEPIILPFSPVGWFQTNAGEGLSVNTGVGVGASVTFNLVYVEV